MVSTVLLMIWSIYRPINRIKRQISTVNSISSFSLYSIHYFQILNYKLAYFPPPDSPKVEIFVIIL